MNKLTKELMIEMKELLELKKLLATLKYEGEGTKKKEKVTNFIDLQLVSTINDIVHIEKL